MRLSSGSKTKVLREKRRAILGKRSLRCLGRGGLHRGVCVRAELLDPDIVACKAASKS